MSTMPITPKRRETFLKVLRETGSFRAACKAASPHSSGEQFASSTWYDLRRRDPEFEAQVQAALNDFIGDAEAELTRRAFEPEIKRHYSRDGVLIAEERSNRESNKLLTRLLARHDPEWRERTSLEVSGSVGHVSYTLSPETIMQLPKDRAALLIELLDEMAQIEAGLDPAKRIEAANE